MESCEWCGHWVDGASGPHGCAESRMKPDLIQRLREDHRDTIECEHGFTFHRDPCPNVVCLARDLAEAADRLDAAKDVIRGLLETLPPVWTDEKAAAISAARSYLGGV